MALAIYLLRTQGVSVCAVVRPTLMLNEGVTGDERARVS